MGLNVIFQSALTTEETAWMNRVGDLLRNLSASGIDSKGASSACMRLFEEIKSIRTNGFGTYPIPLLLLHDALELLSYIVGDDCFDTRSLSAIASDMRDRLDSLIWNGSGLYRLRLESSGFLNSRLGESAHPIASPLVNHTLELCRLAASEAASLTSDRVHHVVSASFRAKPNSAADILCICWILDFAPSTLNWPGIEYYDPTESTYKNSTFELSSDQIKMSRFLIEFLEGKGRNSLNMVVTGAGVTVIDLPWRATQ